MAEMGAAFLCAVAGISPPTLENSASYLAGWLKRIKSDKKLLVQAAGQAQKAADLILGVTFDNASSETPFNAATTAALTPSRAEPDQNVVEVVLQLLANRLGESLTDADLRHELGMTEYTPSDPLANPVNSALSELRDRGVIHVEEPRWGDPRFSVLDLPDAAAELVASRCPATLAGPEVRRLLRRNGWKIRDFAERWGFTQKHVRQVLERGLDNPNAVRDWIEAALTSPDQSGPNGGRTNETVEVLAETPRPNAGVQLDLGFG